MPEKKIKVVFMGTPAFAVPALQALLNDESFDVQAVVTREDQKVGRKQILRPPPVKELALENKLTVLQPKSLKDPDALSVLKKLHPDFIVVVAYGKILPPEVLKIPKYGCINIHGSLLPKYRGASPIEEALLQGDDDTGVAFIKMNEELDGGDILVSQRLHIEPNDTAATLRDKLSKLGAAILPFTLKDYKDGVIYPIPQKSTFASYCRKIEKKDGQITLHGFTAREIVNRIRAYTPWPSCFLVADGKQLKIIEATFDETSGRASKAKAYDVLPAEEGVALGTKKGLLLPKIVQLEGKNQVSIQDFLRGNKDFFKKLATSAK